MGRQKDGWLSVRAAKLGRWCDLHFPNVQTWRDVADTVPYAAAGFIHQQSLLWVGGVQWVRHEESILPPAQLGGEAQLYRWMSERGFCELNGQTNLKELKKANKILSVLALSLQKGMKCTSELCAITFCNRFSRVGVWFWCACSQLLSLFWLSSPVLWVSEKRKTIPIIQKYKPVVD